MILESNLPPVSFQSIVSGQWYIITTKEWIKVDRRYSWEELAKMWVKDTFTNKQKSVVSLPKKVKKQTFLVEGSKGNKYNVINNGGVWSCSCPAFGWGRGKECKHIKKVKS